MSALMNYYLKRVLAKIVVPKPARVNREKERKGHRSR